VGALETIRYTRSPAGLRAANVLLGAWLFASAFLWQHQDNVAFNDWVCGLIIAASALSAIWVPPFRWVSTGLAVWVGFCAVTFVYHSEPTRVHDLALAAAVALVSFARGRAPTAAPEGQPST